MSALQDAIDTAGGLTALAKAIGVTPQVVVHWRNRGLPVDRVRDVVLATDGKVTAHDLMPSMFPAGFEFPTEQRRAATP